MTDKKLALTFLLCFIATRSCLVFGRKVHLVNVLYRHGDRSPTQSYPNSEYPEDSWPQGFGELSVRGMNMQYELGQYLNERYMVNNPLLTSRYSRYEIYVRSTDVNRTLMSAQADLAGLYPPSGDQIWNNTIMWQPIPVHTTPIPDDYLLRMMGPPCPKYGQLLDEMEKHDPDYLKLNADYAEFLGDVSKLAGYKHNLTVNDVWKLHDPLYVEQLNGYALPSWATDEVMIKLKYLSDMGMYYLFNTPAKGRLRGGHLVGQMIGNMMYSQSTNQTESKRTKMFMYSAHDTTLTAFMTVLGVFNKETPPLASCVGVEFIQEEEDNPHKYSVEMWFHNGTMKGRDSYKLTLPGCDYTCPIEDFIRLTKDIVPEDIVEECGAGDGHGSSMSLIILIVLSFVVLTVVIVLLLCVVICRNRTREPRHTRLPTEDANA